MTFIEHIRRGGAYSLAFLGAWFVAEGLYVGVRSPLAPLAAFPLNLGIVAPLVIVAAGFGGLIVASWAGLTGRDDPVDDVLRRGWRWLSDQSEKRRIRRSAWMVGAAALVAVWFGVAVVGADAIRANVQTPAFAAVVEASVLGVSALGLGLVSATIVWPVERFLRWVDSHVPVVIRPIAVALAMALGAVIGVAILWATFPDVMPHLPWGFVISPIAGSTALVGARQWMGRNGEPTGHLDIGLVSLVVVVGAVAYWLPPAGSSARGLFVDQRSVASAWYGRLERILDTDDDGAIDRYGGNDCAPEDPAINPGALDIIGNGIDENCSGADLTIAESQFGAKPSSYEQPAGIVDRPNIILVTTDSLSYDHTSLGDYGRHTTPHLARWAGNATNFTHGFSTAPSTRLAFSGFLAGMFNSMVPMAPGGPPPFRWKKNLPTLAAKLKKRGYHTVFIPGHDLFLPRRWRGIAQGFDQIDKQPWKQARDRGHTAAAVTRAAIDHIRDQPADTPLFLWIHYYDHHVPYKPLPDGHAPFDGDRAIDRFDNELHYADRYWGQLFEAVADTWTADEYAIAFTSDHGEAFDDRHPHHRHGYGLDTPVLHVPLVIQAPAGRGLEISGLVSHLDIPTTLANLAGVRADPAWLGESLIPVIFDGGPVQKQAVFSNFYLPEAPGRHEDGFQKMALRTRDFVYVENRKTGHRRLSDWQKDPIGHTNLIDEYPDVAETYRHVLAKKYMWFRDHEKALTETDTSGADESK